MITSDSIEKCSRIIARVAIVKGLTPFHPRFDLVKDSSDSIYGSSQRIHCRTSFMPYRGNSGGSSGNGGDGYPSPRTEKWDDCFFVVNFYWPFLHRSRYVTGQIIMKYVGLRTINYIYYAINHVEDYYIMKCTQSLKKKLRNVDAELFIFHPKKIRFPDFLPNLLNSLIFLKIITFPISPWLENMISLFQFFPDLQSEWEPC